MKPQLLVELIETAIAPISNYELAGNQLNVRITKPDTSDERIEKLQRGAKFTTNVDSENIIQNLEHFGVQIDDDLRTRIIRDIKGNNVAQPTFKEVEVVDKTPKVYDRNGKPFNEAVHAVDANGAPILTKFKLFQKKL